MRCNLRLTKLKLHRKHVYIDFSWYSVYKPAFPRKERKTGSKEIWKATSFTDECAFHGALNRTALPSRSWITKGTIRRSPPLSPWRRGSPLIIEISISLLSSSRCSRLPIVDTIRILNVPLSFVIRTVCHNFTVARNYFTNYIPADKIVRSEVKNTRSKWNFLEFHHRGFNVCEMWTRVWYSSCAVIAFKSFPDAFQEITKICN